MNKTVAVAMSGGVDSSLTAALLLEQGYKVIGITMSLSDESREKGGSSAVEDSKKVADALGIPHYVVSYHREFKQEVIDYFIKEYACARTPNPCVVCNKRIKFGKLLEDALKLGADCLATGHYVRCVYDEKSGLYQIRKGVDHNKDQSYMMYNMTQDILAKVIFPLGEYTKEETRAMAKERNLIVANKPESQEICFVPNDDYKAFLQEKSPKILKQGDIVNTEGKVLGKHKGVSLYTVGQRKGLGIAAEEPLYVVALDGKKNRVIVGGKDDVFASGLVAEDLNFLYSDKFDREFVTEAKIRYGNNYCKCTVSPLAEGKVAKIVFDTPQRAVTPGQSVVFYDGDILIGGGVIQRKIR